MSRTYRLPKRQCRRSWSWWRAIGYRPPQELRAALDLKDYLEPVWEILDPEELDTSTEEAANWYDWLCLSDDECVDW